MITAAQSRAARGLLKWKPLDLAKAASVSPGTVRSFEAERRDTIPATMNAIQNALEAAGVEFIDENGGGPGVRARR